MDFTFTAGPEDAGQRLDKVLAARLGDLSRSRIQALIKEGAVTVNGRAAKSSHDVEPGEVVTGVIPPDKPDDQPGQPVERRLNLGGTFICHRAIVSGELDLYVEVYRSMQADRGLKIDEALEDRGVTLAEFRNIERRVQMQTRLIKRVREALLEQAKENAALLAERGVDSTP